ncbi:hypothetical protein [Streptomyces sp. Ru62]|nr:hypothetical protein [Streptomyces sp. Ru62]
MVFLFTSCTTAGQRAVWPEQSDVVRLLNLTYYVVAELRPL